MLKSLLQDPNHQNPDPIHLNLIQRMEKLLSSGINHQTVPQSYILPPEKRPVNPISQSKTVPVIDLENNRHEIVKQILQAGKEFGVFQVLNHGVPEILISDMIGVAKEFFEMPLEDKADYYSEDLTKSIGLYTSTEKDETLYWRDFLRLSCYPIEEWMHLWPEKPSKFRENLAKYVVQVRGLAIRLLKLVCEGLGLEEDYLTGDLIGGPFVTHVNHYMPCPDPSLTLGLPKHTDLNLITLLLQGNVNGLQALCDGDWIEVEPIPYSFVVIFGHQLEKIKERDRDLRGSATCLRPREPHQITIFFRN